MYEHVKTSCKHIPPSEQPLKFQSGYFLNKPRILYFYYWITLLLYVLGLRHIWGTREMHTRFWWGYLRERDDYEHL